MEENKQTSSQATAQPVKRKLSAKQVRGYKEFLYILPFLILVGIFSYYPLYGWVYAFFDYLPPKKLSQCDFVGFKWFVKMVSTPERVQELLQVLRNTFAMSGISLLFSWVPLVFAIFLNEIKWTPYKKFVQTVTTLPNFISWVLVFSFAFSLVCNDGAINQTLIKLGWIDQPIDFLRSTKHVWFRMWLWLTWKNAGWTAIMYIAAITGIDEQMIEAAKVDGATRLQTIWHIIVPSILPTYFVIVMLNIASFLSNGMEQYYIFENAWNTKWIQVLDLYVYNLKSTKAYSLSTAISMLKSVVSLVLLGVSNKLSKLIRGESFV